MSHSTDFESRSNPGGLQEIRSWASRSPDSARPTFRRRRRPGSPSSALAASIGLLTAVFLLSLGSYRILQSGRGTSGPAAVPEPEPEQAASSAPVPAPPSSDPAEVARTAQGAARKIEEAPRPPEAVPESRPAPREPLRARSTRPAPASQVVVSRDAFESEPAVLLSAPTAEYPDAARGTGTTAEVVVGFTIDETGSVRDPAVESSRVQGSAPEALFVEEALTAARRARFHPAQEHGVPARSWNTLTFSFETGSFPAGSQATHPPDRSRTGSTR